MKRLLLSALLLAAACHPVVEVAHAGGPDTSSAHCAPETPEQVLVRVSGLLEPVIAAHTGFPPGHENNVRVAFQDILDKVHANIPNVRPAPTP